jgi:hypothetical protein
MRTSEQIDKITAALLAFQKEITPPTKNKENPYFKSMYADLSSLFDHCRETMLKHGLGFTSVGLTSRLFHSSGQWIEGDFACEVHGLSAQQVGSAMTYGRRYNFQGLLGINAEDDDDGAAATKPATQAAAKPAAPKGTFRKLGPNESKLHPPAESDGDRVPANVTDASVPSEAVDDGLEAVVLKAYSKEKVDKKGNANRGVLLVLQDNSEGWWNLYDAQTIANLQSMKGQPLHAKLEDKNGFKLCHKLEVMHG